MNRIFADFCTSTGIAYESAASSAYIEQSEPTLPSRLAVTELAVGAVAAAAAGAAHLARARGASPVTTRWTVDPRRVAASFRGDQLLRVDGESFPGFAKLSGFFPTREGWVRTHANYAHHRARLLDALDLPPDADRAALTTRLADIDALEVEERVRANQGIAVAVRTTKEWSAHPQSKAVAGLPLLGIAALGDAHAPARESRGKLRDQNRPAAGLRVLDLARVIAGPVATRTLALLGADVLRIDDPGLPEIAAQHLDNGMGKHSALLDLRKPQDRETFDQLLETADVVVTGYRPHALDGFGLTPQEITRRRPGIVVATLDAWGSAGPWQEHRGFDSIVQAATGISMLTSADGTRPGALPAQALDHASGYLLAAGVLVALARQTRQGGSLHVSTHLARTAQALLELGEDSPGPTHEPLKLDDCMNEQDTPSGRLRYPLPAFNPMARMAEPYDYQRVGAVWGADIAQWS
ncbi:CoA transferase [Actinospica robiniae]|uniref:CoA transferase n=1 Tax=Actinospica robiniae TaxID=304901 RepID=UPI0004272747|nr:CoA transferase [Actinospica robiniae]